MSVITRHGSPYWWISVRIGDKLIRRSTGILVKGAAKHITADNKRDAEQMEAKYLSGDRKVRFALDGAKTEAGLTLAAYIPRWKTEKQTDHELSTRRNENYILPRLLDAFGALPMGAITPAVVSAWRVTRLQRKALDRKWYRVPKPQTVNGDVRVLKYILKDAVEAELVIDQETGKPAKASPLRDMEGLKPQGVAEKAVMSRDDEAKILAAIDCPQDRALLVVGVRCLQRIGNLLDLRRRHDRGATLHFPKTKNGRSHDAPVTPAMRAALDAIPVCACDVPECAATHQPFFFPKRRRAKREHWNSGVRGMLEAACKRADVPYGRALGSFTWHRATRGTGASRLAEAGHSLPVIQDLGNWESAVQASEYITIDPQTRRRAAADLDGSGANPVQLIRKRA